MISDMDRMYGVKLYDPQYCNGSNLDLMEKCGFNTVFLGRGALDKEFVDELSRRGFFWNIVEPVFLLQEDDPYELATLSDGKPAQDSWVRFACPTDSEHLRSVSSRIQKDIRDYDPPGVSLDFIRFFQFWEMTDPNAKPESLPTSCYCSRCVSQRGLFRNAGVWRQNVITSTAMALCSLVRESNSQIRIGIHCVPWTQGLFNGAVREVVGQNCSELSEIGDYLTPMVYHHMMHRSPSYIREFMRDLSENQGCSHVLPSVQVRQAYREDEMPPEEFEEALGYALEGSSEGVILYKWEDLAGDKTRLDIVRNNLS